MEKEFKNELNTSNEVEVMDDIGVSMVKQNLAAVLDEQEHYAEAIKVAMAAYDNYNEQWIIDKRLFELEMDNFGKIDDSKATHKIELIPEFWELQKKKKGFSIRQETYSAEKRLEGMMSDVTSSQDRLKALNEQVVSLTLKLEKEGITVDIAKLREEFK